MGEIPVGFRFCPTNRQIFSHYLKKKILDPTDVSVQSVNEVDLLKFEPWDLRWQSARQREDEDWYFFWSPELYGNSRTTKKRTGNGKYYNKERFKRSTAAGYWKSTGEETEIKGYGVKRILVFHKRSRDSKTEVKTDYVMHEYDPGDIPDNKKRFVFLRLKRSADDNLISSCRAGSKLLAPNSEQNVTGICVPEVIPLPPAQMKTFDGFNNINQNCVFAKQSPNAYEEESLNFIPTDASSPDEGQQSQDIRSSSPAEGQPNQHQLASDCGNRNLEGRLTEFQKFCQIYYELEQLLPPRLHIHKSLEDVYTSFCDQGQPNKHLTFDFGDAFSEDNGLKVDPQPFSGSETHGGGNRSDYIYSAVPPPNCPEYESSNSKRSNNDVKSISSEHKIQTDEEGYFNDLESLESLDSLDSITCMSSCNSTRGVHAMNSGDHHQFCMGEGIFSMHSGEY